MASTLTDGTYMIRFSAMPTKTGMYRYDVFIDNELVFIGNTYLEGNKNPIIDINDIVMNYNEPLHPKSYGTIAQKSKLLRTVKIKLYLDEPSEIESQVLMIYENPYYNSKVTTPILDSWVTNSIGEMPMLQGWNSSNQNGVFIPTYPAVASPNFTFDYLASKENLPLYHSLNVEYNGGKINSGVQNFSVPDMSVFQITYPLSWLLMGVREEKTEKPTQTSKYFTATPSDSKWFISDDSYYWRFERRNENKYSTVTQMKIEHNGVIHVVDNESEYASSGIYNSDYDLNFLASNLSKTFKVFFYNGSTQLGNIVFSFRQENMPENIKSVSLRFTMLNNRANWIGSIFCIFPVLTYDEITPVCEAKELNMLVFSPVNAAVKYEMTVAKFDNKSRFFLKWKDRYGMVQCQPFSGTELYEENFEKTHTKNFKNERKLVQISNQPKWKLNSNWISQDLYPFYESIFVSPWLQLYDAKFDKLYEVLLTNNPYTEKTFKNQGRQLFNLQLEVEQSKTQNILF